MRRRERIGLSRVLTYGVISIGALSGFLRVAGAQELQKTVGAGPVFSETGPDAVAYGAPKFPLGSRATSEEVEHLVATYSLFDDLFMSGIVIRAEEPWLFRRAQVEPKITYEFQSDHYTLEDYLRRNPTTGLLIAKDDTILFEHYQYARTDRHRFLSQSMAKTITSILIGVAVAEGSIKSIDDTAAIYVPQLAGTEYGKTALRDLLHMASGIAFSENYDGKDDLSRLVADLASRKRAVDSVMQFNTRDVPPGTRFHYASVETLVLGLVLRSAVGKPITDYLREKIWQPIGAEYLTHPAGVPVGAARKSRTAVSTRCYEITLGSDDSSPTTECGTGANSYHDSGFLTRRRCVLETTISLPVLRPPMTATDIRYGFNLARSEYSCSRASAARWC